MRKFLTVSFFIALCSRAIIFAQGHDLVDASISEFKINLYGQVIDISQIGQEHNMLLEKAWDLRRKTNYSDTCFFVLEIQSIVNQSIDELKSNRPLLFDKQYLECNEILTQIPLFRLGLGGAPQPVFIHEFHTAFEQLLQLGAINGQERELLNEFIIRYVNQETIDYRYFKDQWSNIQHKPNEGLFTAYFLVQAAYSEAWWSEKYMHEWQPPVSYFAGHAAADLLGGVYGYASYMYRNWDNHYMDDFGMNALRNGADRALSTSTGSLARYFY